MSVIAFFGFFTSSAHGSAVILSKPAYPTEETQAGARTTLLAMQVYYSVDASPLPAPVVNGLTKYQEVKYYTRIVAVYNKTATYTLLSAPTPAQTYTAEHGASSRYASGRSGPTLTFTHNTEELPVPTELFTPAFVENCTMSTEEEKGACVRVVLFNDTHLRLENGAVPPNFTHSMSGPLQAYATATVGAGSSVISHPGSGSLGAGLLFCFMAAMISAGLFV